MSTTSTSIAHKLREDLTDALEELGEEYLKVVNGAEALEKMLQGSFDKAALRTLVSKFTISWAEDKLNDLESVVDDIKTEFNL